MAHTVSDAEITKSAANPQKPKDIEKDSGEGFSAEEKIPAVKPTEYPPLKPWWTDMVILIAVGCATLVFLVIAVIICYKAIKRKPMRKEENGTSRAEYAMTSQNDKMPDTNSAII
ncbi:hypothetical protein scyTo_0014360 [Scyliorhinus torazame]|uniref:Proline-rich membrane anchor 1 n=1 Tax=Scyliorhinus torazame TaxID=75743 RepID=A0A401NL92_SCYTO|nr:hypothetical protein [Scyliorhinus torazame]